ncbi:MAG: hypothetical protein J5676_03800 [Bacteroidaceae bacterium]|nr:hypothetical protein [Bacteroidaceae bacterium]
MRLATGAFNENSLYPTANNLYDSYIVAPGLINFLIFQLKLLGTMDYNGVFQFAMNMAMLYEVYYIAKFFFSKTVGYIAAILYCLVYSNYLGILIWGTEIPFMFLGMTGLCLCLTTKWYNVLIATVLFAIANTIRPLSILFIITIVIFFAFSKVNWKHYLLLFIPFFVLNFGYGKFNETRMGYYVSKSTTGGTNLLQTANDYADGTTTKGSKIIKLKESKYAYKNNKDKTVFEKDKMWHDAGIEWIKKNPGKYFKMFFYKVPYMYADDSWPERLVIRDYYFRKTSPDSKVKRTYAISMIIKNIPYYIVFILALFGVVAYRKDLYKNRKKAYISLLAYIIIGTGGTVLMPVMARYHYPFLFVLIIFAAYTIEQIYNRKFRKDEAIS